MDKYKPFDNPRFNVGIIISKITTSNEICKLSVALEDKEKQRVAYEKNFKELREWITRNYDIKRKEGSNLE